MRIAAVLLLAVALAPSRAQACAACGCGDQTLTALGVEKPYQNRVRLSLEERYTEIRFGDAVDGETNRTLRSALSLSWAPIKRLTIAALLPWSSSWVSPMTAPGTRQINGLGDLELSGRALLWSDRGFLARHLLWATAGVKMPTGPLAVDSAGYPVDADLQPASGSWDPFAGASYAYFGGLVSAFASASYRITTRGYAGYRFGSALGASAVTQLQPWWWGAFAAGFDLRWAQPDSFANGRAAPDTGGTLLYFSPALLFTPTQSGNLLFRAGVSIPFLQELNGLQWVGTQATLSLAFDLR